MDRGVNLDDSPFCDATTVRLYRLDYMSEYYVRRLILPIIGGTIDVT